MNGPRLFLFRVPRAVAAWNLVALLAFAAGLGHTTWITAMSAPSRVTELDRAGVLDEERLRESHPELAANTRRDVGLWVAEKERRAAYFVGGMGIVVALGNLLLVPILSRSRKRRSLRDEIT